jgi:hypothetical protein
MFNVDDIRTPRDRVCDTLLARLQETNDMPEARECGCKPFACARTTSENGSHCRVPEGAPLAMVYSPCQIWRGIYAPDTALRQGTMFGELDKPWGVENRRGGCGYGK